MSTSTIRLVANVLELTVGAAADAVIVVMANDRRLRLVDMCLVGGGKGWGCVW